MTLPVPAAAERGAHSILNALDLYATAHHLGGMYDMQDNGYELMFADAASDL
jgi:hypothetical protein